MYFYDVGLAAHLMGIEKPEHVFAHPLRGALFENFAVMEVLKYRFNRSRTSNLFFFCDARGNEIDLIYTAGDHPALIEIKSSQTMSPEMKSGRTEGS